MSDATEQKPIDGNFQDLVDAADTGGRNPAGFPLKLILVTAFAWSIFQVWIASPISYELGFLVINDQIARPVHLAFALFLGYLAFPAGKKSPRDRIPLLDWALALIGTACALYLVVFNAELAERPGLPTTTDIVVGCIGVLVLLEATRRSLGPALTILASLFLIYTFVGPYLPELLSHQQKSLATVVEQQWLSQRGTFGIAIGVSTKFVFLFVLFGALLEKGGAGNYFIKVAFASLGHLRGGPAKAAVVASGMTGIISGSSIANVVTTGTFTIPLMKRVGFSSEKAGAVEVASSVNGQITPPVMGAAAFLMVEYVGIPYTDVIKHAVLPALISYIALVYIVHLEAMKANMAALPKKVVPKPIVQKLLGFLTGFLAIGIIGAGVYYGVDGLKATVGSATPWVCAVALAAAVIGLIWYGAKFPELEVDDPDAKVIELPEPGPTTKVGLYFILPIAVLVWCLMIEKVSPQQSAFWATAFMMILLLVQRPLEAIFRSRPLQGTVRRGFVELIDGMITGARNMIGIGIATAAAGIIVGAVAQTGIGTAMTSIVEVLSGGNVLLMLMLTAVLSLILGMGLPTTANYIVVSSIMATVIVELGAQNGLIVPLIAVHMFVFYFGIMADVTPPVGLASFAAAAVSGGDPLRTGFTAFFYSLRTALLPFLFIFNTDLLLIDVDLMHGIFIFVVATIAMLVFAAATQGFFIVRCRIWEMVALLLVAFTLFRPGFWMDMVAAPFDERPGTEFTQALAAAPPGEEMRITVDGLDEFGSPRQFVTKFEVPEGVDAAARLEALGLELIEGDEGATVIDNVGFESTAQKAGLDWDQTIALVKVPQEQPPKELMFIPALLLLAGIYLLQRRRRTPEERAGGTVQPGVA